MNSIFKAVKVSNLEKIVKYLNRSPDLAKNFYKGKSILMIASEIGNFEIINLLISRGADVNLPDSQGYTALNWVLIAGKIKVSEYLIQQKLDENTLNMALLSSCSLEITRLILLKFQQLNLKPDLNFVDQTGKSAIMNAVYSKQVGILKILLDYGFNPNLKDVDQYTPLINAVLDDLPEMVEILAQNKKVNLDLKDSTDSSALYHAAQGDKRDMINALIKHGASLTQKVRCGVETILYLPDYPVWENFNFDQTLIIIEKMKNTAMANPDMGNNLRKLLELKISATSNLSELEILNGFLRDCFYTSGRPKTTMSFINKKSYLGGHIPYHNKNNSLLIDLPLGPYIGEIYIPVLRYAAGMRRALYYINHPDDLDDTEYKGTFYYYDPDSPYLLKSKKSLIVMNKVDAYLKLNGDPDKLRFVRIENLTVGYAQGIYPNTNEYYQNENGKYSTELYGQEDELDQPLCDLALKNGYEILVFLKMPGLNRVVTEILDVRDRQISFDEIYEKLK